MVAIMTFYRVKSRKKVDIFKEKWENGDSNLEESELSF
jgi:hypothetical protein